MLSALSPIGDWMTRQWLVLHVGVMGGQASAARHVTPWGVLTVGGAVWHRRHHPKVALCLGPYGDPRGVGVSDEQGPPVHDGWC